MLKTEMRVNKVEHVYNVITMLTCCFATYSIFINRKLGGHQFHTEPYTLVNPTALSPPFESYLLSVVSWDGGLTLCGLLEDVNECTTKELPPSPGSDPPIPYHHRSKRFVSYHHLVKLIQMQKRKTKHCLGAASFVSSLSIWPGPWNLDPNIQFVQCYAAIQHHLLTLSSPLQPREQSRCHVPCTEWSTSLYAEGYSFGMGLGTQVLAFCKIESCYNVTVISTWISISIPSPLPYHHDHHYIDYIHRYVIRFNSTSMFNRWTVPLGSASGKHRYQGGGRWHSSARSLPPLQRNKSVPQKWMMNGSLVQYFSFRASIDFFIYLILFMCLVYVFTYLFIQLLI